MIEARDLADAVVVLCDAVVILVLVDRIKEWWWLRRQPPSN
jgi:hypothetical protein